MGRLYEAGGVGGQVSVHHARENYERACTMSYRPACEARDRLSE
jgi:TPR repeat protein